MILYTSDLHFGHANILQFDHRPFADVDEMDHVLIELWNSRVQPDDTVYIVGDLCYRSEHPAEWYLRQLKGHKVLVLGNHDHSIVDDPKTLHYLEGVDKMIQVKDGEHNIVLCHYPIVEWNAYFQGSYHVYGHIHNHKNEAFEIMRNKTRALNAGCMINNYIPVTLEELITNNETFRKSVDVIKKSPEE